MNNSIRFECFQPSFSGVGTPTRIPKSYHQATSPLGSNNVQLSAALHNANVFHTSGGAAGVGGGAYSSNTSATTPSSPPQGYGSPPTATNPSSMQPTEMQLSYNGVPSFRSSTSYQGTWYFPY